jgi:hypothetical protein
MTSFSISTDWKGIYCYIHGLLQNKSKERKKHLCKGVYDFYINYYLIEKCAKRQIPLELELVNSYSGDIDHENYVLSYLGIKGLDSVSGVVLVKPYGEVICSKKCSKDCDTASKTVGLIFDPELIFVGGSCLNLNLHTLKTGNHDCYHFGAVDSTHRYLDCIVDDVFEGISESEVSHIQKKSYRDMILYMLEARHIGIKNK